jgi:phosphocarrier protein HPr
MLTEGRVVVASKVGLHARPAAAFVQEARKYQSNVTIELAGKTADAKSIIQVLKIGAKCGQEILIRADGEDEAAAVASLVALLEKVQ